MGGASSESCRQSEWEGLVGKARANEWEGYSRQGQVRAAGQSEWEGLVSRAGQ